MSTTDIIYLGHLKDYYLKTLKKTPSVSMQNGLVQFPPIIKSLGISLYLFDSLDLYPVGKMEWSTCKHLVTKV